MATASSRSSGSGAGGEQHCCFAQRRRALPEERDALPPADSNVCVFPTSGEVVSLAAWLNGLRVVSVGCGEGWLEGLLQREGLAVTAVDLRSSAGDAAREAALWARSNCFCDEIVRIRPHGLYQLPDMGAGVALLFCFGKRCPLQRYLTAFPRCDTVCIAGTADGVTTPPYDALAEDPGWSTVLDIPVRAVSRNARVVCYRRHSGSDSGGHSSGDSGGEEAAETTLPRSEPESTPRQSAVPVASPLRSRFWAGSGVSGADGSSSGSDSSSIDGSSSDSDDEPQPEPEPEPIRVKSAEELALEAARAGCLHDILELLDPQRRVHGVAVRTPHTLVLRNVGLTEMHVTVLLEHLCRLSPPSAMMTTDCPDNDNDNDDGTRDHTEQSDLNDDNAQQQQGWNGGSSSRGGGGGGGGGSSWVARLRSLDLSENPQLGDGAVCALARTLRHCCPLLHVINLRAVGARTEGGLSWSRALRAGHYPDLIRLILADDDDDDEDDDNVRNGSGGGGGGGRLGRRSAAAAPVWGPGQHPRPSARWRLGQNAVGDGNIIRAIARVTVGQNLRRHKALPYCAAAQRLALAYCAMSTVAAAAAEAAVQAAAPAAGGAGGAEAAAAAAAAAAAGKVPSLQLRLHQALKGFPDDLLESIGLLLAVPMGATGGRGGGRGGSSGDWALSMADECWWRVEGVVVRAAMVERWLTARYQQELKEEQEAERAAEAQAKRCRLEQQQKRRQQQQQQQQQQRSKGKKPPSSLLLGLGDIPEGDGGGGGGDDDDDTNVNGDGADGAADLDAFFMAKDNAKAKQKKKKKKDKKAKASGSKAKAKGTA